MYSNNCLLNQRVAIVKPKDATINSFIYIMLKSDVIRQTMESLATGTSQKNLSPIETGKILIAYDENIVCKFSEITNKMTDAIVANLQEIRELINLRDWLLPMLMNGQVTVK